MAKQTIANGRNVLNKVLDACKEYVEVEDALEMYAGSYDKMGELLAYLLSWNGGQGDIDSDIAELLAKLVRFYWREER